MNTEGSYDCAPGAQCSEPGYAFNEVSGRCEGREYLLIYRSNAENRDADSYIY